MRINIAFLSLFLLLLWAPGQVQAQDNPEDITQTFFQDFESLGSSVALDRLYSTNPWMQRSTEAIANLKERIAGLTEDFVGKCHGYELITKKQLTESFILYSFLAKYDRQPIRFTFQVYRPADTWRIYSFKYDSNLDTELEEAARVNN